VFRIWARRGVNLKGDHHHFHSVSCKTAKTRNAFLELIFSVP
jgi:hypothetical protein